MTVIARFRVPAEDFELGRILALDAETSVELENVVPLGDQAVPFFTVFNEERDGFERTVRRHPSVRDLTEMGTDGTRTLYALDWHVSRDLFFQGLLETRAQLLRATGGAETWEFEIRFPTRAGLDAFQEYCSDAHIGLETEHVFNPVRPESGAWYGLTGRQRETLVRAVEGGYYAIPRQISTQELAEEFDISDQAVTERLRRAIVALVRNSVMVAMESEVDDA
ncbi:MAG: helix-turn-helix domain-containing protein [Haloferacaceae archaeon]